MGKNRSTTWRQVSSRATIMTPYYVRSFIRTEGMWNNVLLFFSLPFLTCLTAVSFARVLPYTLGTAALETVLGDTVGQTFASLTRSCVVSKSFCTRHLRVVRCPRNADVTVTFLLPACWGPESRGMDFFNLKEMGRVGSHDCYKTSEFFCHF